MQERKNISNFALYPLVLFCGGVFAEITKKKHTMKTLKLFGAIVAVGCAALFVSCEENFNKVRGEQCKVTIEAKSGADIDDVWVTVKKSQTSTATFVSAASLGTFAVPYTYNIHISWISDDKPKVLYSADVPAPSQPKVTIKLAKGGYYVGGEPFQAESDTIR